MLKKEKWFEQIFNNSGVGILIVDKDRKIIEINNDEITISSFNLQKN